MNQDEQELADWAYQALNARSRGSERSMFAQSHRVGISDVGHCQEFLRRMILQEPETDERDYLAAFLGTAIGDHAEAALAEADPTLRRGVTVTTRLDGDQGSYEIIGHTDLVGDDIVIDLKTVAGLDVARKTGPSQQQLFQRHLYALGLHQNGLLMCRLEDVRTANIWFDRSGKEHDALAHLDHYNPDVVKAAIMWLDDVVYAIRNDEEAQRERPREFCERYCTRYTACRAFDTDVRGLLTDPEVLAAVDIYREAGELESQAKRMRNTAQIALNGVQGSTGQYTVRWVTIPSGHVEYERREYMRLNVQKVRGK